MTITLPGRSSRLIAGHVALHIDELAGSTLRDLAEEYGVSTGMMRTALRKARPTFARQNKVLTIPIRDDGYVVVISGEVTEAMMRLLSRLDPITTEFGRYAEDLGVLGEPDLLDDLVSALMGVTDEIVERLLTSTP